MKALLFGLLLASLLSIGASHSQEEKFSKLKLEKIKLKPEIRDHIELPIASQRLAFNEENGRIFYIPLNLKGNSSIVITITGGSDNSGDGGMTWKLMDSLLKETIAFGSAKKPKKQSWRVNKIGTFNPVLVLQDSDTKFTGKYPGNPFDIQVTYPK